MTKKSFFPRFPNHTTCLALYIPVWPEFFFHSFNVVEYVLAVFGHVGLLREVHRDVEELDEVAEQRAVDGRGLVAQVELLASKNLRNRVLKVCKIYNSSNLLMFLHSDTDP